MCTGSVASRNSEPQISQKTVFTGSGFWYKAVSLLYLSEFGSVPSGFGGCLPIIREIRPFGLITSSSEGERGAYVCFDKINVFFKLGSKVLDRPPIT
jgi:hypothetical protein